MIQGTTSHVVTIVTIVVGRGTPWPWSFQNKHVWLQLSVRMYNYNSIVNMFRYDCRYILQQRFCFKFQGISFWISYEFQTLPLLKTKSPATWPCGFYSNRIITNISHRLTSCFIISSYPGSSLIPNRYRLFVRQTAYKREERPLAQQVIFLCWRVSCRSFTYTLED